MNDNTTSDDLDALLLQWQTLELLEEAIISVRRSHEILKDTLSIITRSLFHQNYSLWESKVKETTSLLSCFIKFLLR